MRVRALSLVVTVTLLVAELTGALGSSAATFAEPRRVAGGDRVTTAVAAAQEGWDKAPVAVVATAGGFPDALAAGALAARERAPLLLTHADELAEPVGEELARLGVGRVYVPGGQEAVSDAVLREIAELPGEPHVERLSGSTRYATAAAVATEVGSSGEAILVRADDFPDAVAASALVGADDEPLPVLLTGSDEAPGATVDALEALDVADVLLVGGQGVIGDDVEDQLARLGYGTERLAGDDRYATSAAVAGEAMARRDEQRGGVLAVARRGAEVGTAVLATGDDFADALAAGPLAAELGGVLVLASAAQPHEPTDAALRDHDGGWDDAVAVGGTASFDDAALASLGRSLRGEAHPEPQAETTGDDDGEWVWPADGAVTSHFGQRWGRPHEGVDIGGSTGEAIKAAKAGTVTAAGSMRGYGRVVTVEHDDAETVYAHLSAIDAAVGDVVDAGDRLGGMGCSGTCTGTHVHFEIRVGDAAVDPRSVLP